MADKGAGLSIAFDSNFLAAATSFQWDGIERAVVPTTTLATTGGKTFEPGETYDPGTFTAEVLFDPADAPAVQALSAAETLTVTFTNAAGSTWAASAFMTSFAINAGDADERVRATVSGKFTGAITIVASPP